MEFSKFLDHYERNSINLFIRIKKYVVVDIFDRKFIILRRYALEVKRNLCLSF